MVGSGVNQHRGNKRGIEGLFHGVDEGWLEHSSQRSNFAGEETVRDGGAKVVRNISLPCPLTPAGLGA
jgi:hypothetical protein